jgi:hypothetical protein
MTGHAITTDISARLDRLSCSRFHLPVVVVLGITWVLDQLEVTIVGSIGPILKVEQTLALTDQQIGSIAAAYVVGAVGGAQRGGTIRRAGSRAVTT